MMEEKLIGSLKAFYDAHQAALAKVEGNQTPSVNEDNPTIGEVYFFREIFYTVFRGKDYRNLENLNFTEVTNKLLGEHPSPLTDLVMQNIRNSYAFIKENPHKIIGHVAPRPIQFNPSNPGLIRLVLKALALCVLIAFVLFIVGLVTDISLLVAVGLGSYMGLILVPVLIIGCFALGASALDWFRTQMHKSGLDEIVDEYKLMVKADAVIDALTSIHRDLQANTTLRSSKAADETNETLVPACAGLATFSTFNCRNQEQRSRQEDNISRAPNETTTADLQESGDIVDTTPLLT